MLTKLENEWYRFASGKKWRVKPPLYLCEVNAEDNIPSFIHLASTVSIVRRVKAFYHGKIKAGILDEKGTAIDILVANAMTESLGTVPSPLEYKELLRVFECATGINSGIKLNEVVQYIASRKTTRYLERREPGYVNPLQTPGRVSLGSHHMLISTALEMLRKQNTIYYKTNREDQIIELCLSLPSQSLKAAQLAIEYLNRNYARHQNHLPLIAATYNAGSPRYTSANLWNLVQYGEHIDRWIAYYNTSRKC